MSTAFREKTVARKTNKGGKRPGAGRPKSDRDDVTVRINRALYARARFVADHKGAILAEYLSDTLQPAVDRDFEKAVRGESLDSGAAQG